MGRFLVLSGLALVVLGIVWMVGERIGLGRLPGDIVIRGERSVFYAPIATSIVLSILLSLGLWLVQWLRR